MSFFTEIPGSSIQNPISYDSKIISLGSCFAVNIAEKLSYFQFRNTSNPFGILFHPLAIEQLIDDAVSKKSYSEKDVFSHQDIWSSFEAHSELNQLDKASLISTLQNQSHGLRKDLLSATHLIITLGTAWVYEHKETHQTVANCHKLPQHLFEKRLLETDEIFNSLSRIVDTVRNINLQVQMIFTISPVRHIKDGFVENQRSKAHLIAGLHQHLIAFPKGYYFPSYEIMMDELRDYRFYSPDMIHPNAVAIEHIWKRFCSSCIHESAFPIMKNVEVVQRMRNHRPFHYDSSEHKKFSASLAQKLSRLQSDFPFMTFE